MSKLVGIWYNFKNANDNNLTLVVSTYGRRKNLTHEKYFFSSLILFYF